MVRDPEANRTPKGTRVCKFSVASNRFYKSEGIRQSEVSYFDVEVWSKVPEACEKHLSKGRGVRVVGRLKLDRWTDDQGDSHYKVKVVGEHMEFKPQFTVSSGPGDSNESEEEPLEESVEGSQ
ncbi:MAG: single-stranded DNA-binding protein [Oceanispirochaeta sp.]|nr:single-stranded DNA-binding protein [Oceanispirochaeta sp.]MDA3958289.1 single-stranded DNA-binding protein [Oceanispirochaeta sp.]